MWQCSEIRGGVHHPNLFLCGQEVLDDVRCVDGGVETLKARFSERFAFLNFSVKSIEQNLSVEIHF